MKDEGQLLSVQHRRRPFFRQDGAGEIAEMLCRQGNVHVQGFADGFAVVHAFDHGQMFLVGVDDVGQLIQQDGPFRRRGLFHVSKAFWAAWNAVSTSLRVASAHLARKLLSAGE